MFTIKHAAQQVGITAATLRAWERRYGVVSPGRTDGGYRVYDDRDVSVLRVMKQLVDDGWSPSLAATEALRRLPVAVAVGAPASAPTQQAPALTAGLIKAAAQLDTTELAAVLDQLFALNSFEVVMDHHVFPALEALGNAWADGRVSVAGEHLASNAVMRRLAIAYEAAASPGRGPRVALGLAPGSRHEIGLFAFAVAARRQGVDTDYLGADLPVDDWLGVIDDASLTAVVLALPTEVDIKATTTVIEALHAQRPKLLIAVGGAEQEQAPATALRLGHDIFAGAAELAAALPVR